MSLFNFFNTAGNFKDWNALPDGSICFCAALPLGGFITFDPKMFRSLSFTLTVRANVRVNKLCSLQSVRSSKTPRTNSFNHRPDAMFINFGPTDQLVHNLTYTVSFRIQKGKDMFKVDSRSMCLFPVTSVFHVGNKELFEYGSDLVSPRGKRNSQEVEGIIAMGDFPIIVNVTV